MKKSLRSLRRDGSSVLNRDFSGGQRARSENSDQGIVRSRSRGTLDTRRKALLASRSEARSDTSSSPPKKSLSRDLCRSPPPTSPKTLAGKRALSPNLGISSDKANVANLGFSSIIKSPSHKVVEGGGSGISKRSIRSISPNLPRSTGVDVVAKIKKERLKRDAKRKINRNPLNEQATEKKEELDASVQRKRLAQPLARGDGSHSRRGSSSSNSSSSSSTSSENRNHGKQRGRNVGQRSRSLPNQYLPPGDGDSEDDGRLSYSREHCQNVSSINLHHPSDSGGSGSDGDGKYDIDENDDILLRSKSESTPILMGSISSSSIMMNRAKKAGQSGTKTAAAAVKPEESKLSLSASTDSLSLRATSQTTPKVTVPKMFRRSKSLRRRGLAKLKYFLNKGRRAGGAGKETESERTEGGERAELSDTEGQEKMKSKRKTLSTKRQSIANFFQHQKPAGDDDEEGKCGGEGTMSGDEEENSAVHSAAKRRSKEERKSSTSKARKAKAGPVDYHDKWTYKSIKRKGGDKGRVRHTTRMDPFNVKRALDPETWNSIRYMEGVVIETSDGIHGYYSIIICEDNIIFLPLSGKNFSSVVFRYVTQEDDVQGLGKSQEKLWNNRRVGLASLFQPGIIFIFSAHSALQSANNIIKIEIHSYIPPSNLSIIQTYSNKTLLT